MKKMLNVLAALMAVMMVFCCGFAAGEGRAETAAKTAEGGAETTVTAATAEDGTETATTTEKATTAATTEDGVEAEKTTTGADWETLIEQEEYEAAVPLLREAADSGDGEAMAQLAYQMIFGYGMEKDVDAAFEAAQKALAAEGGETNALAMYVMGRYYDQGKPMETDFALAMEWYQKAAALGYVDAMGRIGRMFMYGYGVAKDEEAALGWYQKAIENGSISAYIILGYAYQKGQGVEKNPETALEYYLKAYEEGKRGTRADAAHNIARLYAAGEWDRKDEAQALIWAERAWEEGEKDIWYSLGNAMLSGTDEGRYDKAIAYYEKGVVLGSAKAMYEMGELYRTGRGVAIDYTRAKEFYEQAIHVGCVGANFGLTKLYMGGSDFEQDGRKALAYAEKALESDDLNFVCNAMTCVSVIYDDGVGVEKDPEKAMEYAIKTAELNPNGATYSNVGMRYYYGTGVKKDYKEAVSWFEKAAEKGHSFRLGICYLYGNGVERNYEKAMELFLQDLNSGHTSILTGANQSFWYIAYMYEQGYGVEKDEATALKWYEMGAADGDPGCMRSAGKMYQNGRGTEKNIDKAVELYEKAAKNDSSAAYSDLGDLYVNGQGVPKDLTKAIAYFEKGAELGSSYSYGQLGWIYAYVDGLEGGHDFEKARIYYEKGAELDSPYCYERLGIFYEEGKGVEKDPEKAGELLRTALEKAVEQNNETMKKRAAGHLKRLKRAAEKIMIGEKKVSLLAGGPEEAGRIQLTFTVSPETSYWQDVIWSSSDESIATVDENGVVKAVAPGKVTIRATTTQPGSDAKPGEVVITVFQAAEAIELDQTEVTIPVKKNAKIKAKVLPDAAAKNNKTLEWSSEDEGIATVKNGQISGKSAGTTTVTAKVTDGSGVSAKVTVTVVVPVKKIACAEKNVTLVANESCQLTVEVSPEDATEKGIAWSSSDETVATVDESGKITATGVGKCVITGIAKDGSKAKVAVKVTVK